MTMAKRQVVTALGFCILLLAAAGMAQASLLQDRFGVTPQLVDETGWVYDGTNIYSGYRFDVSSLAPTKNLATVDYNVDDWYGRWNNTSLTDHTNFDPTGTWPLGSEPYDVEAMYFDDDGRYMYISIITSVQTPTEGIFVENRDGGDNPVVQGDLAFDLGMSGSQTDQRNFTYNYGLDTVDENRPPYLWDNVTSLASDTVGTQVYRTTGDSMDGAWYLGTPNGSVEPPNDSAYTNFDPSASPSYVSSVGTANVSWTLMNLSYNGSPVQENNYATYLIEAVVPLDMFPRFEPGQSMSLSFLPGCRNDGNDIQIYMDLDGDLDMPEPGTYAFLALGALALGFRLRKRRKS